MTSATRRPRGSNTEEEFDSWLEEPADVARPMLPELAAQPRLQFLPADEGNTQGRAANNARTARTTALLATIATMSWLTGCSASASSANDGGACLQAAAGQSFQAPAPDDSSTEGGGLSQQGPGRARDVVPVPGLPETAGAGGAASNQESTGTGRAVRDRSGLVDAWPEIEPTKPDLTVRSGLSKG